MVSQKGRELSFLFKAIIEAFNASVTRRKLFPEWFMISALGESRFPNGLAFPRLAKVVSRMVWYFRAWRKSFPEWFGVSALGESHFLNGFAFAGGPQITF